LSVRIANRARRDTSAVSKKESKLVRKKKVVRRAWSKEDVRVLKTMAKTKAGVTRIAKSLKRTIGATAVKAHQLGVSLDTRS
jgi:hypothetical protein